MSRRDEVLLAALDLLDEVGLEDLTTRRLAERLGVQPSAMYRHFASKQALLDAMVEHLATVADGPVPDGDWSEQLRRIAEESRNGMLRVRDGARLIATHRTPGPAAIAAFDQLTAMMHATGLPEPIARSAVDTVICYVNGFTIEEQSRRPAAPTRTRADKNADFRAGLELIITGIRCSLPAG